MRGPWAALASLARLYPWDVAPGEDLRRALGFLDAPVSPETVVRGGYGAALACLPAVGVGLAVTPRPFVVPAALVGLGVLLGLVHVVHRSPRLLATARRTRALGDAPALVGRVVLRMRVTPALETAAAFAARTGTGPLAASLDDHVRRSAGQGRSGLASFSEEWVEWFPALRRGLLLVESADTASPAERERTLDRGLEAVLAGARDRTAEFAAGLRAPTTALYAFGVLLPLALVALLPAVQLTGVSLPLWVVVLCYDLLLPAGVLVASAWLLARRPVTFPPPAVSRNHPDLPDRRWPPVVAGLGAAGLGAASATAVVGWWAGPVAGLGCGTGVALVGYYRPMTAVRDRVNAVEEGLTDALYFVGRRVEEGRAVETAIAEAADEIPAATGAVFESAARRQRQLKVDVETAFLGEHGALADVPSPRARSTASLLALAGREGRPVGGAIVAMADNLDEMAAVERAARTDIASVTSTLTNTAAVFAPLVAGATVAMSEGMTLEGELTASGGPSTGELGLAVGIYVLVLAVVLTVLSTGLARGLDRALVGYRSGVALVAATTTYLVAVVGAGLLV
ncbi:MAG: type II secretion system protein [Halorientalis sp.]